MEIIGANIFVEEYGALLPSELMKISYWGMDHYFQRNIVSQDFDRLESYDVNKAKVRLQGTMAKPFIPGPEMEMGFLEAIESEDREVLRFHIEGFLEIMAERDLLGQEE